MYGFVDSLSQNVRIWSGNPDCQLAHDTLIKWLRARGVEFKADASVDDNILKGNLGETIAFYIGLHHGYGDCHSFAANALRPFNPNSSIDFDIVWVFFGQNQNDDWAALQEVKATSGTNLAYADALIPDYNKLFGTNLRLTLQTRFQDLQAKLEFESKRPDLGKRLFRMAGNAPSTSSQLKLLPTLVHEKNNTQPQPKMLAVRETLVGMGWGQVEAWAVGLSELDVRIVRIAKGQN